MSPSLSSRHAASQSLDGLYHPSSKVAPDRKRSRARLSGNTVSQRTLQKGENLLLSLLRSAHNLPATFQWIRGDLLGKGTYAKVYLALNATTGEIMAVKQVELLQTPSDRLNSRHRDIIEALHSERKTLMQLDHDNIVQYLGYEESLKYLSMYISFRPIQANHDD